MNIEFSKNELKTIRKALTVLIDYETEMYLKDETLDDSVYDRCKNDVLKYKRLLKKIGFFLPEN